MDSESGVEEIRALLPEEDDLCLFLELVAPLVRAKYETHAQLLEAKMKYWIGQYENYLRALSPGRHATVIENEQAERIASEFLFMTLITLYLLSFISGPFILRLYMWHCRWS